MAEPGERERYEAAVRALRKEADTLLNAGQSAEDVAVEMVARRNTLKQVFRIGMDPHILTLIEARNFARYGDAIGPTPWQLLERYGDWYLVIDAACRPADLSRRRDGRNKRP